MWLYGVQFPTYKSSMCFVLFCLLFLFFLGGWGGCEKCESHTTRLRPFGGRLIVGYSVTRAVQKNKLF